MKVGAILPNISYRFQRVWFRNLVVWSKYYKSSVVANLVEPVMVTLALGYGFKSFIQEIEGVSYIQYIVPGFISYAVMNAATFECTFGFYSRMTSQKTFDAIISTPVNIDEVVMGEILFATSKGLLASILMTLVFAAFGMILSPYALFVPFVLTITGFVFSSTGVLYTSFAKSWDFFAYYLTLFITPMIFISGTFIPLSNFPPWVEYLAWFTPLYHSIKISRELVLGNIHSGMLIHLLWLLGFGWIVFTLAVLRIRNRMVV